MTVSRHGTEKSTAQIGLPSEAQVARTSASGVETIEVDHDND
ncbi:hypothetical protein [Labrys sp. ZIDIC5]|nr:hypothetical protein [Labrys sp. ZIDIC5]MDZ5449861.1 hypothetical protein [Labrys sp. ZIDIC5]